MVVVVVFLMTFYSREEGGGGTSGNKHLENSAATDMGFIPALATPFSTGWVGVCNWLRQKSRSPFSGHSLR